MLGFYQEGKISLEKIIEKMCHAPAICFKIDKRGFLREGYYADLAVVDLESNWTIDKSNILYQCNWSPFEGHTFKGRVQKTFVNGHLIYNEGEFNTAVKGRRLLFNVG
jgi:dihydroorotase